MRTLVLLSFFFITSLTTARGQGTDKVHTSEITLNASPEAVWSLLSDVSQWKKWDSHVIDARLKGDFENRAEGSLVTANAKVVNFQIVDWEANKSYTLRHKLSSGTLFLKRTVAPSDSGSKVVFEVWCNGLSKKNFSKYMGDDYGTMLQGELEELRTLLENP